MESRLDIDVPSQSLHRLGTSKHCDLDLTSFESWGANNIEDDGVINETQNPKKGIAKWYFNKKKRKRQYISLTGKKLEGYEATVQYRLDKMSSKHPSRSSRIELKHLIETINIHHLLDAFNNDDHTKYDYLTQLSAWGLPPRTIAKYAYRKILRLFPWQVDCLCIDNGSVLYGNNLVYSAPTSGGKTLVTEILMLRRIVKKMGTILFIVPFVALVIEKSEYFRDIWSDLHISVQAYHGDETSNDLHPDLDVCVCTFERANIILNNLIENSREDQISMVVVDEIHMVAEANRGYLLEVIFSKIRYILRNNVQCIGLSATLPNISDIAAWLEASLYTTEYRPVNLTTRICQNGMLYRLNEEHINETTSLLSLDRILPHHDRLTKEQHNDSVYSLCLETIGIKKSILIFCSSKSFCETYAQKLAGTLVCKESNNITEIDTMRLNIINGLRQTSVGLCPILRHTIRSGVAYHHAGLTTDERTIIENGFRSGAILVLCATSTLAAGVNLPAHRVIIRSPYMVKNPLSIANFRQMCGRAGRLGLDENGEAILIIRNDSKVDADLALKLMTAPIEPTLSSLNAFNGRGLVKLLLEMICCGRLSHESAVMEFISFTLMNLQHAAEEVRKWTRNSIQFLKENQFVMFSNDLKLWPTQLGLATTFSGLIPMDALEIFEPLRNARRKLILRSGFHGVFLITPPSFSIVPNWTDYDRIVDALYHDYPDVEMIASEIGISRADLISFKTNPPVFESSDIKTRLYKRFYSAIILFRIIQEIPLTRLGNTMKTERGQMQSLQKEAAAFCGMTIIFCRKLNWELLASCLESLVGRLSFGVSDELLPLVRLGPEITTARARALLQSGILNPHDIIRTGIDVVAKIMYACIPFEKEDPMKVGSAQSTGVAEIERRMMMKSCSDLAHQILRRANFSVIEEKAFDC